MTIDLLVDLIKNAIINLVDAFVWFNYWTSEVDMHNGWVWLGAAYLGYLAGSRLGYHYCTLASIKELVNHIRQFFHTRG